jgi:replication factor C subunit 3/5
VVLSEVDKLSKQAQAGLRRTMEKYSSQCRVILLCNSPSKVIEPIRSRCLGVRIPAPSEEDISTLLMTIAKKESSGCSEDFAMKISKASNRNIRRAILMLEAAKVQGGTYTIPPMQAVALPDWELYISKLSREILAEQSPSKLQQAREMLYDLLTNCIPADVIMQTLVNELMKSLDDTLKHEVAFWAAYYEHRMRQGSKEIFHLEAFVAKFMAIYKKWLVAFFG